MRPLHSIAAILLFLAPLSACGVFQTEDAGEPDETTSSSATMSSEGTAPPSAGPIDSGEAQAQLGDSAAETTTVQTPPETAASDATPSQSLEDRIDLLIAAHAVTQQRLDSLTALVSGGEAGVGSAGPGDATTPGTEARPASPPVSADAGTGASGRSSQPSEVLDEARSEVRNFGVGILWSIVIVFLFNYLIQAVAWVLDKLSERSAKRRLFFKGLVPIVRIVLWLFAGYLIVRVIFQVDAQGVVAGAAALGVAIGFAAQDLLKNLFGGIILVFDQPFQVGDKIRVGETYGEVTSIGLRSTRIVTPDDNLVSVPNAQVVDQQVANANAGELNCQVVIDLYLPGDVDEARAKKIAFEAAVGSRYVYLNKPIVVLVRDELHRTVFTRVRVKAYVLDPRHEFLFESDVTERARSGFRAAGMMGGERVPPDSRRAGRAGIPVGAAGEDGHNGR